MERESEYLPGEISLLNKLYVHFVLVYPAILIIFFVICMAVLFFYFIFFVLFNLICGWVDCLSDACEFYNFFLGMLWEGAFNLYGKVVGL